MLAAIAAGWAGKRDRRLYDPCASSIGDVPNRIPHSLIAMRQHQHLVVRT